MLATRYAQVTISSCIPINVGVKLIKRLSRELCRQLAGAKHYMNWQLAKSSHESVFFYTFHKCASTLFSKYVLKNIEGLRQVDHASRIYREKAINNLVFKDQDFVYGPLRLFLNPVSPEYTRRISFVDRPAFVRNKIAIFLLRDPRDILVSAIFSFGYTHSFSRVRQIRELQQRIRRRIKEQTVDEYALESAD